MPRTTGLRFSTKAPTPNATMTNLRGLNGRAFASEGHVAGVGGIKGAGAGVARMNGCGDGAGRQAVADAGHRLDAGDGERGLVSHQVVIEAVVGDAGGDHDQGGGRAVCDGPAVDGAELDAFAVETGDCMIGYHRDAELSEARVGAPALRTVGSVKLT